MKTVISFLLVVAALAANAQPQAGDQELFDRARALWDQGQQEEALDACGDFIKHFPKSKYVPDAYLMFAEYYFDNAKPDKALLSYKKVTEFKDSKVFPYALYKMGWCYFNLQKFDKALAQFTSVVKYYDKQERATGEKSELRLEALNDLTRAYSHAKAAKAAPAFFLSLAPNEAGKLLTALAGMYFGDGKYQDAVTIYRHIVGRAGCSADAPSIQLKIIDCHVRIGIMKNVPPEVRRLVELFAQLDKCLAKPTDEQKEKLDQAREEAERTLYDLAVFSNEEAVATQDEKTVRLTRELADSYLKLFPKSSRAAEIRSLLP
jgi:tetratricopeptide (TPR) repeat protein